MASADVLINEIVLHYFHSESNSNKVWIGRVFYDGLNGSGGIVAVSYGRLSNSPVPEKKRVSFPNQGQAAEVLALSSGQKIRKGYRMFTPAQEGHRTALGLIDSKKIEKAFDILHHYTNYPNLVVTEDDANEYYRLVPRAFRGPIVNPLSPENIKHELGALLKLESASKTVFFERSIEKPAPKPAAKPLINSSEELLAELDSVFSKLTKGFK